MICTSCSRAVGDDALFCSFCGHAFSSVSQAPTGLASPSEVASAARLNPSAVPVGRLATSDSIDAGGFTPGAILGERYRIIGLLGRGGMGEVYRADDLKLGQPVALKFLPPHLAADRERVERFFTEVRLARQVSHPNVCRVYDIGEMGGQHFLSMEYVDGEDLGALLRRIGRFPGDRALEIARQLCTGLAASHDKGVLHRDLKPSNVMIDGRGRAKITDFGLAVAAGEATEGEISGTPAYMAPEQLSGKGASIRTDIYALGLVLYELSTGKKAFDGASVAELRRKHAEDPPTAPSSVAPGFDPAVERAILRCLEKDPALRPSSVAQVAASFPGGDPLAAAIAAGETPSPEMVAAAGDDRRISIGRARALLTSTLLLIAVLLSMVGKTHLLAAVDSEKPPEVLRARAREILAGLGMPERPADWAEQISENSTFLDWVSENDHSVDRWRRGIARDALDYQYRQSPAPLVPDDLLDGPFPGPLVTETDPPPSIQSGNAAVVLDADGRLKSLDVTPPEREASAASWPEPDWSPLFRAAGLDASLFRPVEPRWTPPLYADRRAAWEGPHPERPGLTMRMEAAAYRGRPVHFRWLGPWSVAPRDIVDTRGSGLRIASYAWLVIINTLFLGAAWFASKNVKGGRSDRRGAARLAAVVLVLCTARWVFSAHHVFFSDFEFGVWLNGAENTISFGVFLWLLYLALEPYARRHWPDMLISWSRLLAGRFRDPLVGRALLVGASASAALAIINGPLVRMVSVALGAPLPQPREPDYVAGPARQFAYFLMIPVERLVWTLGLIFFLVFARRLVRSEWVAAVMVTLLFSAPFLGQELPIVLVNLLATGLLVFVAIRSGLLAALVMAILTQVLRTFVATSDPLAWYFWTTPFAVVFVLGLAIWGYRAVLPSRAVALAEV
jgi:hypothetical protein